MFRKGFTLIELIIVIAIIATIVGAVFVALDPAGRLQDAREAQVASDAEQIQKAIELYFVDNGSIPAAYFPNATPVTTTTTLDICATGSTTQAAATANATANTCLDPGFLLTNSPTSQQYLPKVPTYAGVTNPNVSGYKVSFTNGAVTGVNPPVIASGGGGGSSSSTSSSSSSNSSISSSSSSSSSSVVTAAVDFLPFVQSVTKYVEVPAANYNFNLNNAFTLSAWIRTDDITTSTNQIQTVISKTDANARGFAMFTNFGRIGISFGDTSNLTHGVWIYNSTVMTAGAWTHVACTFSGNSSNPTSANTKCYVNGGGTSALSQPNTANNVITNISNATTLKIGAGNVFWFGASGGTNAIPRGFTGGIDEVRIYNAELTQAQVTALANTNAGDDPPTTNLVGYWKLNENTGTTTADAAPLLGNDAGTLIGSGPNWIAAPAGVPQ